MAPEAEGADTIPDMEFQVPSPLLYAAPPAACEMALSDAACSMRHG